MTLEKVKLEDFKGGVHPFQSCYWAEIKREMHWSSQAFEISCDNHKEQVLLLLRPFVKGEFIIAYFSFAFLPDFFRKEGNIKLFSEELKKFLPKNVICIRYDFPFVYDDNQFSLEDYLAFAKREKLNIIKESVQPEGTVVLNLKLGYEEVKKLYRKRARRILKKNEKKVQITTFEGDETDFFDWYGVYRETAKKDGFTARDKTYLRSLLKMKQDCSSKLYLAKIDGKIKGGIIVLSNDKYSVYLFGASFKSEYYNVSYRLQDYAIQDCIANHKDYYDFYGISGLNGRETHLEGLNQFKSSFGGKKLYRIPTCDYILKRGIYGGYSKLEYFRFSSSRAHPHK